MDDRLGCTSLLLGRKFVHWGKGHELFRGSQTRAQASPEEIVRPHSILCIVNQASTRLNNFP